MNSESSSIKLLPLIPEERLSSWLKEFYGKDISIASREVLRHRDFSYVERLKFKEALPDSLIYKLVIPPWDIEQDLHERILIPSIASSAQLFMTAHLGQTTAMFLEDLGDTYLKERADEKSAKQLGEEIARMHRAYSYRIEELVGLNILRSITPGDFSTFAGELKEQLDEWGDIDKAEGALLLRSAAQAAEALADEPITLVHGDLYAENVVCCGPKHFIIDWSWFTIISVPMIDLAALASDHEKNGELRRWSTELVDAYCFEYGRSSDSVNKLLPQGRVLERLLFLCWLVERKRRGVTGTTVGPVEGLMKRVIQEIEAHSG